MPILRRSRRSAVVALAAAAVLVALVPPTPASAAVAAPVGLTPSGIEVSGTPTLAWSRVAGATSYSVQYSQDSDFGSGVTKATTVNRRYVPTKRLPSGTIWWRVQTKTADGTSGWSTTSFESNAAAGPALLAPSDGDTLKQPDEPVLLSWSPVPAAASYTVEIDDSPDFLTPTIKTGIKTTAFIQADPKVATTYYWRVKAAFDGGVQSTYSEEWSYDIEGLDKAGLVSPPDDPTNAVDDVVLKWTPVLGAHHYELQVSTADSFATTVDSKTNLTGTTYSPTTTYENDQYYWRVRPVDPFGNKLDWTEVDVWEFRRSWPLQPEPEYPVDNQIVGDPLYFQWTAAPLASQYTLQISTSPLFTAGTTDSCTTKHTTFVPKESGDCYPGVITQYYWRVLATDDSAGIGSEVDHAVVESFSYEPERVDMDAATPADGSTVAVPTFSWTQVEGASRYEVYLEAVTPGADGTFAGGRVTNTTSLSPTSALTEGATYRWYVQTLSESGRQGTIVSVGGWNVFTVGTPVTGDLVLTSPAHDSVHPRYPKLTWTSVADATSYKVWTRNANNPNNEAYELMGTFAHAAGEDVDTTNLPASVQWYVEAWGEVGGDPALLDTSGTRVFHIEPPVEVEGFRAAITGEASDSPVTSCAATLPERCENMRQTPVLRWDAVADAGSYKLWISRDPTFTNVLSGYNGIRVENPMFIPVAALPESQAADAYYWQVVPCTRGDACAPRTDATHAVNKRSNPVEPISPTDEATGPDSVTFTWEDYLETNLDTSPGHTDSTDVNARIEAERYQVQVSTVPNFQTVIHTSIVDQKTFTHTTAFYPEGILYWRVAAIDGSDNLLTYSEPRKFTKATPPPVLRELNNGSPLQQTVPFEWEPTTYTASYRLEIYKNGDTVPSTGNRVIALTGKQSALTLTSPLAPSALPYTWRVRKVDASGNLGPWTSLTDPFASFRVSGSAPVQVSPLAGARLSSTDGYFTWTAVAGARNYRFERRRAGETSLAESTSTSSLGWAPTKTVTDGTWQWRVVAVNAGGSDVGASPWRSFVVDGTRPTVTSVSPKDKATGVKRKANFKATFSEPVTNVTKATARLYLKGRARPVAAKVTLSASRRTMTLNPKRLLKRGKVYTVKISSAVRDLNNLALVPKKWKVTVKR